MMPAFGSHIIEVDYIENSMVWGKENLPYNPHGTLFLAKNHGFTRGRNQRIWSQYKEQLLLTYLVKPINTPSQESFFALYHALTIGIAQGINSFIPETHLKWPNDCIIHSKKVAGLLIEPVWQASSLAGIVFGIGINVNHLFTPDDSLFAQATSMRMENNGIPLISDHVLVKINDTLTHSFHLWHLEQYEILWTQFQSLHLPLGTAFSVHRHDTSEVSGTLLSLEKDGAITLLTRNGPMAFFLYDVAMLEVIPQN